MSRTVQRSLVAYLPTRKRAPAITRKDEQPQSQQQQADAAQHKKARQVAPQLVEAIQPPPSSGRHQHKRQRTDALPAVSDFAEPQRARHAGEQHDPPTHQQQPPPSTALWQAQTNQHAAKDPAEPHSSSTAAQAAAVIDVPAPLPHVTASPHPPSAIPHSARSSPSTDRPSSALPSRRSAPSLHGDTAFLSAEQRRRRDYIEQTVRDCLQVPDDIAAEPTRAQLASLIHPSANRPSLPRPNTASPSTPSKPRSAPSRPASSVSALAATVSSSSPASASIPSASCLPLPVPYRFLLSVFSALECATTVRSQSSALWSVLCPAVVRIVQKAVSLSQLQQLAALVPDCYELREERTVDGWGRAKVDVRVARLRLGGGETEAEVGAIGGSSAASSAELSERRQLLEQRLLDRAIDEHSRWHRSSPYASEPFDPLIEGRWHTAFPLDSLPPLDRAEPKGAVKAEKLSALDALESLSGQKRKWDEVEPLTPRSSVSRSSSIASELLLTPSTRSSSNSSVLSSLNTPSTPFTAKTVYVEQFRRRAAAKQFEHADRATPAQLERLQHLGKLPLLLDVVLYSLQTSQRNMLDVDHLLALVSSGNPAFTQPAQLRLQFDLLLAALPAAFSRRSVGPAGAVRLLVGATRRMGVDEMRAVLKAAKDREEAEMREERRLAREALLRSVEGAEAEAVAAAAGEAARVPHVASPAKRSLQAALMAVSPGGTERPVANQHAGVADATNQQASRQLYR